MSTKVDKPPVVFTQFKAPKTLEVNVNLFPFMSPITEFLTKSLGSTYKQSIKLAERTLYDLPVAALATAAAFVANKTALQHCPSLAASVEHSLDGSYKVAAFVGVAFLVKTALEPFIKSSFKDVKKRSHETRLRETSIRYLTPTAITLIAAHVKDIKVKPIETCLYTLGIFSAIKILGQGLKLFIEHAPLAGGFLDTIYGTGEKL